jgi:hypothetical protein
MLEHIEEVMLHSWSGRGTAKIVIWEIILRDFWGAIGAAFRLARRNKGGFRAFRIYKSYESRYIQKQAIPLSLSLSLLSPELKTTPPPSKEARYRSL